MKEIFLRKKRKRRQILEELKAACAWAGISKGRVLKCQNLFSDTIVGKEKTRDHFFAYNELAELIEIYQAWEKCIHEFPGLNEKIRAAFTSGPMLPEDEQVKNSGNRSRNDSFVFLLAGKLHSVGIEVLAVDGVPSSREMLIAEHNGSNYLRSDIWIRCFELDIGIECKRPLSLGAIPKRAVEARKQLNEKKGMIAIDCSSSLRPPEMILDASTEQKAGEFITNLLSSKVEPVVKKELTPEVIGAILHMRTPVHTIDKVSPILDLNGNPITTYYQETASTLFFLGNSDSPDINAFRAIKDQYMGALSERNTAQEWS